MSEWRPIDSAPDDRSVLLYWPADYGPQFHVGWMSAGGWWFSSLDEPLANADVPTHWLPLPEAPK